MRASSVLFAILVGLIATGSGCASNEMRVDIDSTADTNGGRPFYVVLRSVEQAEYVTDSYDAIAKKAFATPPDPALIRSEVIYPGVRRSVTFDKPATLPVGIYFLFTEPGERWKTARNPPFPSSIKIQLGKNQIIQDG
jgi:hypothetical protein